MNNGNDVWNSALKILSRRAHSEYELRQKLYKKDYEVEQVDQVIPRLLSYGYINDHEFAKNLFEKYLRLDKYSFNIIICKLKQHGVTDSVIKDVTYEYSNEGEWRSALKLVRNRFKTIDATNKEKFYRFLGTRGFSSATIHKVFQEFEHNDLE